MKSTRCLPAVLFLLGSIQSDSKAANSKIDYVELTDNSTHAGTRKSRANLKCVEKKDSSGNGQDISLTALAGISNDDGTLPSWSASVGSISGSGTSATWTGQEDTRIKGAISGKASFATLEIVGKNERSATWDSDPYKKKLEALQRVITAFATENNADNPVTLSGGLKFETANVDKFNEGELTGKVYSLKSDLVIAMAQIKAEAPNIPTPWPFIFVTVGIDMAPISLDLGGAIKYDDQFANPWIASSIYINPKSSVKAYVEVLVGAAASAKQAGIKISGSAEASIQANIKFNGEGNKITTEGAYKMGSLLVSYEVKALISVLGAEATWKFADGTKQISKDGEEQKIEKSTLYEW